jgi:transketolase
VIEIDGNDFEQVVPALDAAIAVRERPTVIIAHTVKGKGVSFMEGLAKWHGVAPNAEELARALAEVRDGSHGASGEGERGS